MTERILIRRPPLPISQHSWNLNKVIKVERPMDPTLRKEHPLLRSACHARRSQRHLLVAVLGNTLIVPAMPHRSRQNLSETHPSCYLGFMYVDPATW